MDRQRTLPALTAQSPIIGGFSSGVTIARVASGAVSPQGLVVVLVGPMQTAAGGGHAIPAERPAAARGSACWVAPAAALPSTVLGTDAVLLPEVVEEQHRSAQPQRAGPSGYILTR